MIKLYTDAGLNTNLNLAAISYVFTNNNKEYEHVQQEKSQDNHYLEFKAVKVALLKLIELDFTDEILQLCSDSQIVVDSISKNYSKHYQESVDEILPLLDKFPSYFVKHISDKENKAAHSLIHQELIHLRN
ncbi:reverse transcriptase-like protein [Companilactobacillus mishanensis]|uniref:Reverse transcriptase-like protein n=1 Tax=Companilactobacillus mishanensis TaxID=2486008 RepID=A0ABW9P4V3_9LACO|nr:reverse transcriptase-like protein [Companilactobacillus mishanensis]MQS44284.1 reverse transcriptase-like protein [Companilactobacillus mishanensis]